MQAERQGLAMKDILAAAVVTLCVLTFVVGVSARQESDDPCYKRSSNVEMRECYRKEQVRVSAQAESLTNKIADKFRKDAQDPKFEGPVAEALRKAASSVIQSQKTWRAYRDQHCKAVAYSFTNGTGAGTAYESCLLQLGQERLRELQTAFERDASQ